MGSNLPANTCDPDDSLVEAVSRLVDGRVRRAVPLASMTTFGIGGLAQSVVTVESEDELRAVVTLLRQEGREVRVIGFGSNLLVSDDGVLGWVIRLGTSFRAVKRERGGEFIVSGAASLMTVARKVSDEGFSGLEFAAGIPASVGGAVFMNAGAHGTEIGERVVGLLGVMPDGTLREWRREELPWGYRHSGLPQGCVIISAQLRLVEGDREEISKKCADNLAHRRATQPLSLPSAGSVFKNPRVDLPAGRVLEEAGLKGVSVGGASVSMMHANWIVNPSKSATARDVLALIDLCQRRVYEHARIALEPELKIWNG